MYYEQNIYTNVNRARLTLSGTRISNHHRIVDLPNVVVGLVHCSLVVLSSWYAGHRHTGAPSPPILQRVNTLP